MLDGEVRPPLKPLRQIQTQGSSRDKDGLVALVAEAVRSSDPVLIFCASRKQCQSCAQLVAELLPEMLGPDAQVEL